MTWQPLDWSMSALDSHKMDLWYTKNLFLIFLLIIGNIHDKFFLPLFANQLPQEIKKK